MKSLLMELKLEANANKYTFVWRKAVQKRLDTLPSKLAILKQDIWNELGLETHCMKMNVYIPSSLKKLNTTYGTRTRKR